MPMMVPQTRSRAGSPTENRLIALVLAFGTILLLLISTPQIGLTWDEPIYLVAQQRYVSWFEQLSHDPEAALSRGGIQQSWEINHEHPPLAKLWGGLVARVIAGEANRITAGRIGNILLVGLMVAMLFLLVTEAYGRLAGILAVVALLSMPRFFFHAHLAALDMPATVSYVAVVFVFWRTRTAQGFWASLLVGLLLALVWGIALATKINAAFALPVLSLWIVLACRRWGLIGRLLAMVLIGPWVFVALWPWLYVDTWERLAAYIAFITVDHWKIDQLYFGKLHLPPPWHFPFVMLLFVLPLGLVPPLIAGIVRIWRDRRPDAPALLWALAALFPLLALTTGKSMVYDNERLFMATFPFLAALAGTGLAWGIEQVRRSRLLMSGLVAAAFLPQLIQASQLYPHLLSYYSETVGGLPGATRMGMETTYWCETYGQALSYINANAHEGAIVWSEEWSHDVLVTYQQVGMLRSDLRISTPPGVQSPWPGANSRLVETDLWQADYVINQVRESGYTPQTERFRAEHSPVLTIVRQGVTLMELYERR